MNVALKLHEDALMFANSGNEFGVAFVAQYTELNAGQYGRGPDREGTSDLRLMFQGLTNVRYPMSFEDLLKFHPGDLEEDIMMGADCCGYSCGAAIISSTKGFTDQYVKHRFVQCAREEVPFQAGRFLYGLFVADEAVRARLIQKDVTNLIYIRGDRVIEMTWIPKRKQWYLVPHHCDTRRWPSGTRIICFV